MLKKVILAALLLAGCSTTYPGPVDFCVTPDSQIGWEWETGGAAP